MPFVGVPHAWLDPKGTQGANPTDSQQDFLAEANPCIPAVQPGGEGPIFRGIVLEVGIEKEESGASDLHFPHQARHHALSQSDLDAALFP